MDTQEYYFQTKKYLKFRGYEYLLRNRCGTQAYVNLFSGRYTLQRKRDVESKQKKKWLKDHYQFLTEMYNETIRYSNRLQIQNSPDFLTFILFIYNFT